MENVAGKNNLRFGQKKSDIFRKFAQTIHYKK
jgi:hypothetical protein